MKAHLTLFFALLLLCSGAVLAQGTPDWKTPAQETICDGETGAAYGLCNAYCEAMDCESDSPQASATACTRVRTKYQQVAGHDLPCEAVNCPCNDPAVNPFFAAIVAGEIPLNLCLMGPTPTPIGDLVDGILVFSDYDPVAVAGSFDAVEPTYVCASPDGTEAPLTPAQGQLCADLLEQAAANWGVTCGPAPH